MTTPHTSYYSNNSSESFGWPQALLLAALSLVMSLVTGAYLQLIEVSFGATLEFAALTLGLLAIGLGLLAGVRMSVFKKARNQIALGAIIVLQALMFYLLSSWLLRAVFILPVQYLITVFPLVLTLFFIAALTSMRLKSILDTDTSRASWETPVAIVAGIAFGTLINSVGANVIGAPVLLLASGGIIACLPLIPKTSTSSATFRIVPLALIGVLTVSIIAQVLLKREERQSLDVLAQYHSPSPVSSNKFLWTYGPRPLAEALIEARSESSSGFLHTMGYLNRVFDDSLSILLVNGTAKQLDGIASLNCSDATITSPSPLSTILTNAIIGRKFSGDESHAFHIETAEGFEFVRGAERLWDVIFLVDNSDSHSVDALKPATQETQEFYSSCLTHLSENGFIVFETKDNANGGQQALELFQRLSAFSIALRSRGVKSPESCFVSLPNFSASSTTMMIFSETPPKPIFARIQNMAGEQRYDSSVENDIFSKDELLTCFMPGVAINLSEQYNLDLRHLTLERPFPGILPPGEFAMTQPVYANPLNGTTQAGASALYDALSAPIGKLTYQFNFVLGATISILLVTFLFALTLSRKVINSTVHATRHRQRRAFLFFAVSLSGYLIMILPAVMEQNLRAGALEFFPIQARTTALLISLGAGVWLSARKRFRNTYSAETGLTIALLLSLAPAVLSDLSYGAVAGSSSNAYLLLIVSFIISPALFGATAGLYFRRERLLESPGAITLLSALMFTGIGAMLIAKISTATFGFGPTMELGILLLGLTVVLQLLQFRASGRTVRA